MNINTYFHEGTNMRITINGESQTLEQTTTIGSLLEQKGYNGKLVAVALNGEFLSKTYYDSTTIKENDKVEIVAPMQGG